MTLRSITDFFPLGTQMKSPGGFTFDPRSLIGIEAYGESADPRIVLRVSAGCTTVSFHRNIDGGPPAVYEIAERIEKASKEDASKL